MDEPDLLADPIYQLNFTLWMLQPLPQEAHLVPVMARAGYMLDSLSRPLPLPPVLRSAMLTLVPSVDAPSPDVLAEGPPTLERLIVECKGNGFGLASTSARQLLKLLAVGADLTGPLGLPTGTVRPAHVAYLLPVGKADAQVQTIRDATSALQGAGVTPASGSVIAVSRRDDGVYVDARGPSRLPAPVADAIGSESRVVFLDPEEDPHLLYLIPWDPSVEQPKAESDRCRAILFSKVAAAAAAELGHAVIPQRVSLAVQALLAAATYGVSNKWRDRDAIDEVQRQCTTFLADVLKGVLGLDVSLPRGPHVVQLTLTSEENRGNAIEAILSADPLRIPDTTQTSWLENGSQP